ATLWTVWAIDFSVPGVLDRLGKIKGTDFLQFYVSGSFVREGRSNQLYDLQAQLGGAQAVAPASHETVYLPLQTPQTALAAAPLSAFPYTTAVGVWIGIIVVLYAAACAMTWTYCTALHAYRYEPFA